MTTINTELLAAQQSFLNDLDDRLWKKLPTNSASN